MSITEFHDIKDVISQLFSNQRINNNLINILMYNCKTGTYAEKTSKQEQAQ